MIHQGFVEGKVMDFSSKHQHLPPIRAASQWPRSTLDRTRYPRAFPKDKNVESSERVVVKEADEDELTTDIRGINPVQNILHLEKSIAFIRAQHADVLGSLHTEIMQLKEQNKDLQLKLIMLKKPSDDYSLENSEENGDTTFSDNKVFQPTNSLLDIKKWNEKAADIQKGVSDTSLDERYKADKMKIAYLIDEVRQLKHSLNESRNRNFYMSQAIQKLEDQKRTMQDVLNKLQYQQQERAIDS